MAERFTATPLLGVPHSLLASLAVLIVVAAGCDVFAPEERLDLSREPGIALRTEQRVGDRYTVGMFMPSSDPVRALRITGIEVVRSAGLEVVGLGAYDPAAAGGIGAVPGWPPEGYDVSVRDEDIYTTVWNGRVDVVVGVEVMAIPSGFRGVRVRWVDDAGRSHSRLFDHAAYSCAPGACADDEQTRETLIRLGLLQP